MSVDAGLSEIMARMQQQAEGGPGLHVGAEVGLDLRLGRLVSLMEQEQRRRAILSQMLNVIDLPPLDFTVTGNAPKFKTYRAAATDLSPQEALFWFVTRLSLCGLNAGDVVNLHRTVSSTFTANLTGLHTFIGPAGVAAGLGIADWEPGTNGLILRPDDQLFLASGGTIGATELILSGQAIQVHLSVLADFLM